MNRPKEDEEAEFSPFSFTELNSMNIKLMVSAAIIFTVVVAVHLWVQILTIFLMYNLLVNSNKCLELYCGFLKRKEQVPIYLRSQLIIYSFADLICSYLCVHVFFWKLTDIPDIGESIASAILITLFMLLFFSALKSLACSFHFFRVNEVENGALGLLTYQSLLFRYILVMPIWICYMSDSPITGTRPKLTMIAKIYIIAKVVGFWYLCYDFFFACKKFFQCVILRSSGKCMVCGKEKPAMFTTRCGHTCCLECITHSREIEAACPICKSFIPRKWTLPYNDGVIPYSVVFSIL